MGGFFRPGRHNQGGKRDKRTPFQGCLTAAINLRHRVRDGIDSVCVTDGVAACPLGSSTNQKRNGPDPPFGSAAAIGPHFSSTACELNGTGPAHP